MIGRILLYLDKIELDKNGYPIHWYGGYWNSRENKNQYISAFTSAGLVLTNDIKEAKIFFNDGECNKCMKYMVEHGAQTICVWEYDNLSKLMKLTQLKKIWKKDSNKYIGYGFNVMNPIDFDEEFNSAIDYPSLRYVAYPSEYWSSNNYLRPSLMYSSVAE